MNLSVSDSWIATERGTLFARSWEPSERFSDGEETILLLHDSLGCVELWRDFPAELAVATGRSVVAYDRLGFGRSAVHEGRLSFSFIRDEAAYVVPHLLEALRLTRIIPFGHSVGGAIAVATAAQFPGRCSAVITESAQSFVEDRTLAGVRAGQAEFKRPDRFERLSRYHGGKASWVLDAWTETWLAPEFAGWKLDDDLRRVACATLALHGDRDEFGSVKHPERIARLTSGAARAVILEGCGHVPHRENPAWVLREVTDFLAHCDAVPLHDPFADSR